MPGASSFIKIPSKLLCILRYLVVQVFPLNGAMLNGSSLLLVQNVSGQIELSRNKITCISVQLPIYPLLDLLLDRTD